MLNFTVREILVSNKLKISFDDLDEQAKLIVKTDLELNKAQEELDFVDIAGPEYLYGNDESTVKSANATTNIIPLVVWEWEMNRHDTVYTDQGSAETFASNISVSVEFDVLIYAVCYPEFNGTGVGIWHDPTFSVYLIFESKEFWALVVLIAGVGLVGVATILIKRRKDMRI